jgi:hypothetical protein
LFHYEELVPRASREAPGSPAVSGKACLWLARRLPANYSGILGSLAAGGISNLYYPAKNRDGAELTFENALIGIGESAAVNLLQEFVIRRLTPSVPKHQLATP